MNPKLEAIFNEANLEFYAQLDAGMSERFGEIIREYLEEKSDSKKEIAFIVKDYKQWCENHPEMDTREGK